MPVHAHNFGTDEKPQRHTHHAYRVQVQVQVFGSFPTASVIACSRLSKPPLTIHSIVILYM